MISKPKKIYKTYDFTYDELLRLLWLFGTSCAVKGQNQGRNQFPITTHTDAWVIPKAIEVIEEIPL